MLNLSCGVDWKDAMLRKCKKLDFYSTLIRHNCEERFVFFKGNSFKTIYCNIAYWLQNVDSFMQEMKRILRDDGLLYLQIITQRSDFAYSDLNFGNEWHKLIDRGRKELYKTFKPKEYWFRLAEKGGFEIIEVIPTFSTLQAKIWDIGLRPIVPYLIEMSNLLNKEDRKRIKVEFCETIMKLIKPFVEMELTIEDSVDFFLVLSK